MISLRFYPTEISYTRACLPGPIDDTTIAARMQKLCAKLGTGAPCVEEKHCLEIAVKLEESEMDNK